MNLDPVKPRTRDPRDAEGREAMVRAVLLAPVEMPHKALGRELGISRELVRRIRIGDRHAHVAPELPRLDPEHIELRCTDCVLFHHEQTRTRDPKTGVDQRSLGRCSLGIPEAAVVTYARGCGAYAEVGA